MHQDQGRFAGLAEAARAASGPAAIAIIVMPTMIAPASRVPTLRNTFMETRYPT
jgi:hypothetical protein